MKKKPFAVFYATLIVVCVLVQTWWTFYEGGRSLGFEMVVRLFLVLMSGLILISTIIAIVYVIYMLLRFRLKRWKEVLFFLTVISVVPIVSLLASSQGELDFEPAVEIAQTYFEERYGKNIVVEDVEYRQVNERAYLNVIRVLDGETKYELYLDRRNKPSFDDVAAVDIVKNFDMVKFKEKIEPLGLKLREHQGMGRYIYFSEKRCVVYIKVDWDRLPDEEAADDIYSLLGDLQGKGIDMLYIGIRAPDFLGLEPEFRQGLIGALLAEEVFETDIDRADFEKKYNEFINEVYWDEQKFEGKVVELRELGYQNAAFFVKPIRYEPNIVEIILYYEPNSEISDEYANTLLNDMDESYFKIRERETIYTLFER